MNTNQSIDQTQWWLLKDGVPVGPFSTAYIHLGMRTGVLSAQAQACPVGGAGWRALQDWEPFGRVTAAPPVQPQVPRTHADFLPTSDLPSMVQWIRGYSLVLSPALLLISLAGYIVSDFYLSPASRFFPLEVLSEIATSAVQFVAALLLFLGAIGIASRNATAVALLRWGLAIDIVNAVATSLVAFGIGYLAGVYNEPVSESGSFLLCLLIPVNLGAFVFEIVALFWLVTEGAQFARNP